MGVWSCCRPWPSGGPCCWGWVCKRCPSRGAPGDMAARVPSLLLTLCSAFTGPLFSPAGGWRRGGSPSSRLQPWDPRRQDKLQTETLKDFWVVAQWADSARRWLVCPSRPPAWLCLLTPAPANSCQALAPGTLTRGVGLERRGGQAAGGVLVPGGADTQLGLHPGHPSALRPQGSRGGCRPPPLPAE